MHSAEPLIRIRLRYVREQVTILPLGECSDLLNDAICEDGCSSIGTGIYSGVFISKYLIAKKAAEKTFLEKGEVRAYH